MILPDKHTTIPYSLLGQGGAILKALDRPLPPRALFDRVSRQSTLQTYERFLLTLDFLYLIGCLDLNNGLVRKASP